MGGASSVLADLRALASRQFVPHSLVDFLSSTGAALGVSSASGTIWRRLASNVLALAGQTANNNSTTSVGHTMLVVPNDSVDPKAVKIKADLSYIGSATVGASTFDVEVFRQLADGTLSADLCTTAAQAVPAARTVEFELSEVNPNDLLVVKTTLVTVASTAADLNMQINRFGLEYTRVPR